MPAASHVAIINAYEIKTGGFRGVYFVRATKERIASDVLPTLAAATHWAKSQAYDRHNEEGYTLAPIRRRGEYLANVWVRTEG